MSEPTRPSKEREWYYSIEVEKGVFTRGRDLPNIAITRDLLRSVGFSGFDCLDIGTQEAVIPILLKKGGAKRVTAYDRRDLAGRVGDLQKTYGVAFEYIGGIQLPELPAVLDSGAGRFFDLVIFSGVLYHMINPLGLLALVRGLCKIGGLFLIETTAIQDEQCCLIFNADGKQSAFSCYFIPTTTWLDYVLRLLGLRPVSVRYFQSTHSASQVRLAVLCRSEAVACPLDKADEWAGLPFHERAFSNESQVNWDALRQTRSNIEHRPAGDLLKGSLYESVRRASPYVVRPDEVRLSLNASM